MFTIVNGEPFKRVDKTWVGIEFDPSSLTIVEGHTVKDSDMYKTYTRSEILKKFQGEYKSTFKKTESPKVKSKPKASKKTTTKQKG